MDTLVPLDLLPQMYGRDARTIRRWIRRDGIRVIEATNEASAGRKAVWSADLWRWGPAHNPTFKVGPPLTAEELRRPAWLVRRNESE
jgi:hypothetical protein